MTTLIKNGAMAANDSATCTELTNDAFRLANESVKAGPHRHRSLMFIRRLPIVNRQSSIVNRDRENYDHADQEWDYYHCHRYV